MLYLLLACREPVDSTVPAYTTPPTAPLEWRAVAPSDPRLRYAGRWDTTDPEAPWAGWQGASVSVRFTGTALTATLAAGTRDEWFRVVVDGGPGTRFLASAESATYTLVEGLPLGVHDVSLVKETYQDSLATLTRLTVLGALEEPPPAPTRHMAFYGDSNLAGTSLMSEHNEYDWSFVGSHFTYAGIASRVFDADYQNVSWGGARISDVDGQLDRMGFGEDAATWDASSSPVDVAVVNVGSNDVGRPVANIMDDYQSLLGHVRALHPDAHIVLFESYGWSADEPANYIDQVIEDFGDANASAARFPWLFEQFHGCETDHAGMAAVLAAHLEEVLGWEAGEPDVPSGFGEAGDVANGGFEGVAPFGGWGWRYFDAPGVERVVDPASAHGGSAFLRLTDGASSHQPNPAAGGDQITVTAWLRGITHGDEVKVTIDFRDQDIYSLPLKEETWTEAVSTEWRQATWSANAPLGPAVFHTRLTFRSMVGGVDIDDVQMTIDTP